MHKSSDGAGESGQSQPGTVRDVCFCIREYRHSGRQIALSLAPRRVCLEDSSADYPTQARGWHRATGMRKYYSLYGQLFSQHVLHEAFRHVRRNKGAAGIDGQSLSAFEANLEAELSCL